MQLWLAQDHTSSCSPVLQNQAKLTGQLSEFGPATHDSITATAFFPKRCNTVTCNVVIIVLKCFKSQLIISHYHSKQFILYHLYHLYHTVSLKIKLLGLLYLPLHPFAKSCLLFGGSLAWRARSACKASKAQKQADRARVARIIDLE